MSVMGMFHLLKPSSIDLHNFSPNHPLHPGIQYEPGASSPPRQSANPFVYIIRRLDMCVVLSTAASFFLLASPRLEYGYFSQDEKGGSGRVDGLLINEDTPES